MSLSCTLLLFHIGLLLCGFCFAGDPTASYELEFSYITASPLGVPQQVVCYVCDILMRLIIRDK
ncbi:hypothetical protein Hanom_Chr07g00679591 [Helianthus anomalus]